MTRQHQKALYRAAAVAGLILAAYFCRKFAYVTADPVAEQLANFTRIFIYLGLFAAWGIRAFRRVMQTQVRRYLVAVAVLMVFWLAVRELRWHFVLYETARRYLWYAYYIPLLCIPLIALLVSMSLNRAESYRLPRRTGVLYLVTLAWIALVFTNDLHRLVFVFPDGMPAGEDNYRYGVGFYLISAWSVLCALAGFVTMLRRSSVVQRSRVHYLPGIPFGVAIVYFVLYAVRQPLVMALFDDLAVTDCLLFALFFESCIRCGLIQSNALYADLFKASVGVGVQILDGEYAPVNAGRSARPLPVETMRRAEDKPLILPDGQRVHNMRIRGGHAVWTEDISELLRLQEELEDIHETLTEHNEFLQYSYARDKEHTTVAEQNRLYDLLESKTTRQINEIHRLTLAYGKTEGQEERRQILERIVILGTYVKRYKDFVLTLESAPVVPESMLAGAFDESFRALALYGIRGGSLVRTERGTLSGDELTQAYDFFEDVMEASLAAAQHLSVRVCPVEGVLRINVLTDRGVPAEALAAAYPGMICRVEEDGTEYVLPLKGGAAE